jgi:hypothetical protein
MYKMVDQEKEEKQKEWLLSMFGPFSPKLSHPARDNGKSGQSWIRQLVTNFFVGDHPASCSPSVFPNDPNKMHTFSINDRYLVYFLNQFQHLTTDCRVAIIPPQELQGEVRADGYLGSDAYWHATILELRAKTGASQVRTFMTLIPLTS